MVSCNRVLGYLTPKLRFNILVDLMVVHIPAFENDVVYDNTSIRSGDCGTGSKCLPDSACDTVRSSTACCTTWPPPMGRTPRRLQTRKTSWTTEMIFGRSTTKMESGAGTLSPRSWGMSGRCRGTVKRVEVFTFVVTEVN